MLEVHSNDNYGKILWRCILFKVTLFQHFIEFVMMANDLKVSMFKRGNRSRMRNELRN